MTDRWLVAWCGVLAAALFLGAAVYAQAPRIAVTPIARDGQVLVSFRLDVGLSPEVRDAIHSGLATTFAYDVELRRAAPVWFDRTMASVSVRATVRFDNLTRRYQLSRTIGNRADPTHHIDDEESVRRWLTEFDRLPLATTSGLEPNGEYYVRVRARMRPRTAWLPWPWDRDAILGRATFTFVQ
jgi:hypothetical protein